MFCQSFFEIGGVLELWFLGLTTVVSSGARISRGSSSLSFGLIETCNDALVMCLRNLLRDAFHTKDFDFQPLSIGQ